MGMAGPPNSRREPSRDRNLKLEVFTMTRYEYDALDKPTDDIDGTTDELDALGDVGWRLVSAVAHSDGSWIRYLFIRELPAEGE